MLYAARFQATSASDMTLHVRWSRATSPGERYWSTTSSIGERERTTTGFGSVGESLGIGMLSDGDSEDMERSARLVAKYVEPGRRQGSVSILGGSVCE